MFAFKTELLKTDEHCIGGEGNQAGICMAARMLSVATTQLGSRSESESSLLSLRTSTVLEGGSMEEVDADGSAGDDCDGAVRSWI